MMLRIFLPLILALSMLLPGWAGAISGPSLPKPTLSVTAIPGAVIPPVGTFTRACTVPGSASYVNNYGQISYSSDNLLRTDYDPVTHDFLGWLLEPQSTNLLVYSQDFTQTSPGWVKNRVTIGATTTAPDGTNTAQKVVEDTTATQSHVVAQQYFSAVPGAYTFSVFAKAAERNVIALVIGDGGTDSANIAFDLINGITLGWNTTTLYTTGPSSTVVYKVGTDLTSGSCSMKAFPGGWYRCSITVTKGALNTTCTPNIQLINASGTSTYTGDGTSGVYLWCGHLEQSSSPTSYIPTVSLQNTRYLDLWTAPDINLHGNAATLYADFDMTGLSTGTNYNTPILLGSWGTGARWGVMSVGATGYCQYGYNYGADIVQLYPGNMSAGPRYKMAFSLAPGAYAASLNGGAAQTAALSTLYQPSPATVYLGSDGTSAGSINGHLKQAAIYPTALTNAQLQAITSADPAHLAYPTLSLISDPSTQPSIGTYTRSSTATYTGSDGLLHTAASGVLRYDYSPTVVDSNTGGLKGLVWLFEEARTRLNTISAAPSAPENVTVTAQAYTLSFYGTGTMTLSGAYSGSAVGTGAYPSRKALTFTPSAGTLTLTPSGSITNLQLEAGAFATSVMMGEGSTVTRAADVWTIPTASFPFNASEGTLYAWFDTLLPTSHTGNMTVALLSDNSSSNYVQIAAGWYNNTSQSYIISGVSGSDLLSKQWLPGVQYKAGVSYKSGAWKGSVNGAAPITAATASVPTMTRLDVGQGLGGAQLNGHIIRLDYIPKGDSNADLQLRTSALETGENEYAMAA